MSGPSEPQGALREKIIGLGEKSIRKSYYPELQRRIRELEEAKTLVERKNEELERYLYVASHDLRSPLVNIQGFSARFGLHSEEIARELEAMVLDEANAAHRDAALALLRDKIPRAVGFIVSNTSKMDRLLGGLLEISRTGRVAMAIRVLDMNELLASVIGAKSYEIEQESAVVEVSKLPPCYGDWELVSRAFGNLIGNSLKYRSPDRAPVISITGRREGSLCKYSVRDNGIGISERNAGRVWDVFFRVDSDGPIPGDGVGLSIVKRIADKHRGTVSLESHEGVGSVFSLSLPVNNFEEGL